MSDVRQWEVKWNGRGVRGPLRGSGRGQARGLWGGREAARIGGGRGRIVLLSDLLG